MTQVPGRLTETPDPSLLPANRDGDASREVTGPVKRLVENSQTEPVEPTSTAKVNSIGAASIVNTARECTVAGMTSVHSPIHSSLYLAEPLNPSAAPSARHAPVRPPHGSVDQPTSNLATETQENSHRLEQVIGSTLSPDGDVQEGAKHAGQKVPDSYIVPVVPIIATLGQHGHPADTKLQLIPLVSSNPTTQPNHVPQDVEWSSRAARASAIQQKAEGLAAVVPVIPGREKGAPEASSITQAPSSTRSKSTSSPDGIRSSAGSRLHSAYPLPPSECEGLDELSTRAVRGDTSIASLSTSIGHSDSVMNTSSKAVAGIGHAPRPIFSEEHGRALATQHGRHEALATGAIAGGATSAVVAAKERDNKEGKRFHFQHSTSPGVTKSSSPSGTRKLTKGTSHSLPDKAESTGHGRANTAPPAGAAFPESTYAIDDDVGALQDLTKDPLLAPLPVSRGDSRFVESTPTPACTAGSLEHKRHRLTKRPSPTADAPPRVSDNGGTTATKPKLMDRIKGEMKIMQGTFKGDEEKKMEGRILKEFGSF